MEVNELLLHHIGIQYRLNGAYFLLDQGSGQTVFNTDGSKDTETGGLGSDWFFAGTADKITDLSGLDQAFIFGLASAAFRRVWALAANRRAQRASRSLAYGSAKTLTSWACI